MQCQNCKVRDAKINVSLRFNDQTQQLHLCETCFQDIKKQSMNPTGFFGGNNSGDFSSFFNGGNASDGFAPGGDTQKKRGNGNSGGLLDEIGRNLSHAAKAGLIDPVIGRQQEVKRVIETLNRRNKNNPVLIGEPGVGKTAIAEGLALKIAEGTVPAKLANKEIYLLDVASLVANTGIRGQFEERMKKLISELQNRKNVILFVDEIHLLVGAGTAEGSQMDAGNILKPALARGELQLVGATTLKEYRNIEKDAALERRLQPIIVKEPSVEEAIQILQGLQDRYENYHHVSYSEEAIRSAVTLSRRYIQDRFLPDKAIDLMDEAGARLNLTLTDKNEEMIQEKLKQISAEKEEAAEKEDYEKAANLRHEELLLEKQLKEIEETPKLNVTVEDIELLVEEKTGIPVRRIQAGEQEKMKNLQASLAGKVIGQDSAVEKVSKAIRRSRAGLKSKNRPIGSFLFAGPTGVGKTELSRALAEEIFGSRDSMIRLDMSEYMEKHSVSKIIGSPPGYVGHEEAGQLTEQVRRNPYSLILLDEIEKAHPDVQNMFLQIMEDGHLTDGQGRRVSFKETVIIMTSNAGTGERQISVGFEKSGQETADIMERLSGHFKPEFLNRIDSVVGFNNLNEDSLLKIVTLMLEELSEALEEKGYKLSVTEEAKKYLADKGYDPRFGARPLRRVIQEHVEDGITDLVLDEEEIEEIYVDVKDGAIEVQKA